VLALASLSLTLRLWLARGRPLWFDELFTWWAARLPARDLFAGLRRDSGPPAFYLLEKPFARIAESSGSPGDLLRAPAFLAVLLLFAAARVLPRGAPRSWFLALLSGSALLNLYSGEARPYGLLALLCLSLFLLATRGAETGRRLAGVGLVSALALYTHYLTLFAVLALLIVTAASRRWRSCAALLAGAALFAPWIPVLAIQPREAVAWMHEGSGASMLGFLSALGGVGRVPAPFGPPPPPALFLAGAAAGALGLALLLSRARSDREARNAAAFVVLVLAGVLAAGLRNPIAFAGRTELAVLPVWIFGLAASTPASRAIRGACAAIAGLGLLATLAVVLPSRAPSAPLVVAETIGRVAGPGDSVVAAAAFYLPARLAHETGRLRAPVRSLPAELEEHPGWFVPSLPGAAEERLLSSALAAVAPGRRLFLVVPPDYATPGLARVLDGSGGRARFLMRSRDALVTLWTRDPPRPSPAPADR
jgi:hypothetical protein